jgi:uncharacterized protein YidB (DUF937 family)
MTGEVRPAGRWEPTGLGVHRVAGGGPQGPMPPYIRRRHDDLLRAVLDPAVPDSRLVVLRGDSCTGRSRAVYEALADRLPDWPVRYPVTAAEHDAGIPAGTVLWLGELRRHVDADDGVTMLRRLDDLLYGEGYLVIATVWPEDWDAYAAAAGAGRGGGDPARVAGLLLAGPPELVYYDAEGVEPGRGGVIDVPDRFTEEELAAAAGSGDPVLAAAAAAGDEVTQYLAGAPGLLRRYAGPGGDRYGQAIITAAMDAARFGHAGPLPAALLRDAGGSGASEPQAALAWAGAEVDGAVRALEPVTEAPAGVAGYRIADYLDQHGRRTRLDQAGTASLWDALADHARATSAGDLNRLAQAARDRGLYRHAAALWTAAAARGSTQAGARLVAHLRQGDAARAAAWVVTRVSLDDPWHVASLLAALRAADAGHAVRTLLARDPAGLVSIDRQWEVLELLSALHAAGAGDAVRALAARLVEHTRPDDLPRVASLLKALAAAGADDAARTLAGRASGQADLDDPSGVALLLEAAHAAGATEAVRALAARAADHTSPEYPDEVARLLQALHRVGAGDAVRALLARDPAGQTGVDSAWGVTGLLAALRTAGADQAVETLAARIAGQAELDDAQALARLLDELRADGAGDAIGTLLARDPAGHVDLWDVWGTGCLIGALHAAGADQAAGVLATRAADDGSLDIPEYANWLLRPLRAAGADAIIRTLATRIAGQANLDHPQDVAELLEELRANGAGDAARTLLARDPARHADPGDPWDTIALMGALRAAGADAAAGAMAGRAAGQARLDDPQAVAGLLGEFRDAGAGDAVRALLARDPARQVSLQPGGKAGVGRLLTALRAAGAGDAARALAARAADAGMFDLDGDGAIHRFGREPDGAPAPPWSWAEPGAAPV